VQILSTLSYNTNSIIAGN